MEEPHRPRPGLHRHLAGDNEGPRGAGRRWHGGTGAVGGLRRREQPPAFRTEGDAGFHAGGVVEGEVDLDALLVAADFELNAAGAADAARGGDDAGERCAVFDQLDIVRPEIELRGALAGFGRGDADGAAADPIVVLDLDGQRRFADEAEDERLSGRS